MKPPTTIRCDERLGTSSNTTRPRPSDETLRAGRRVQAEDVPRGPESCDRQARLALGSGLHNARACDDS